MRKLEILVIFETHQRAAWYVNEVMLPLMPRIEKKNVNLFESDMYRVHILSAANEMNLRGRLADLIYASNEISLKQYTELVLPLVKGDHSKIKVVE